MLRFLFIFCILATIAVGDVPEKPSGRVQSYLNLLKQYPEALGSLGNWQDGEIEIITDPHAIEEIERRTNRTVGIIAQDKYWTWLNDAVRFPTGTFGVYGRMMWTRSLQGLAGVAVLCLLPDGKVALNCNFRHATRSWEVELPRGGVSHGETYEEAARREVLEETGMVVDHLVCLGVMAGDTGFANTTVPVYLANVVAQEEPHPEDSEAIEGIVVFTICELLQGIQSGQVAVEMRGVERKVELRDPFLTYAVLQAGLKGLISGFSLVCDEPIGDGCGNDNGAGGVDVPGLSGAVVEDDHLP